MRTQTREACRTHRKSQLPRFGLFEPRRQELYRLPGSDSVMIKLHVFSFSDAHRYRAPRARLERRRLHTSVKICLGQGTPLQHHVMGAGGLQLLQIARGGRAAQMLRADRSVGEGVGVRRGLF